MMILTLPDVILLSFKVRRCEVADVTSGHALIVEDDRLSGQTLVAILRHHGYRAELVTTVQDGLSAINSRPRCVLLDLMLPDGDGALVLASIRSKRLASKVAIVTSVADGERLASLQGMGADRVFKKPVNPDDLIEWMTTHGCVAHRA